MGRRTGIAWTNATWNPWRGCTKVSPGCAGCYMFREQRRYGNDPTVVTRSKTTFDDPIRWKRKGVDSLLIFTCSWSDFFHPNADEWRPAAWEIIRETEPYGFTYQILTKRPELVADRLPRDWGSQGYPNVWLGISAERQKELDERAPTILDLPAALHFLSAEPLLGPLDLAAYFPILDPRAFDWIIAGGESGPGARFVESAPAPGGSHDWHASLCEAPVIDWLRSIRDQCQAAAVPFFLKQLGGAGKARSGADAVLDGRTWTEIP